MDDVEIVLDTDCEPVLVTENDALRESVTVLLGLTVNESNGVIFPVELTDPLHDCAPDWVTKVENVVEMVDEKENVPEPDCEGERVLHGDAV